MEYFELKNSPRVQRLVDYIVTRRRAQIAHMVRNALSRDPESIATELGIGLPAVLRALCDG